MPIFTFTGGTINEQMQYTLLHLKLSIMALFSILAWQPSVQAQSLSNLRQKTLILQHDTTQVDTLSLVPGSVILTRADQPVPESNYTLDLFNALLIWKGPLPSPPLQLRYRVFPFSFTRSRQHKDPNQTEPGNKGQQNPFTYSAADRGANAIFHSGGIQKTGSISRGIAFGNNQDLSVNSTLNLELSGQLTDQVQVLASITDDNIPIQPDGNTQQLQDFDQVFIQLFDKNRKLTAGDFQLRSPRSHFLRYHKKAKGVTASVTVPQGNPAGKHPSFTAANRLSLQGSAAASRGKFGRNTIQGEEGNQGPYRLTGAENEPFIMVLSGTERVYIDGQLLTRGQENDYVINYNTSELTFTANRLITKDKRITIEFQYSDQNYVRALFQTAGTYQTSDWEINWNMYSEQDMRNQPILQELSDTEKRLFSSIGDSLELALIPAINRVDAFTNEFVLYAMTDSLGYDSVFRYSTHPDSAMYQLSFTEVGDNNGHYVPETFTATGRVYKWVAPDTLPDGSLLLKGNYRHIRVLVAPKKRQMVSFSSTYQIHKQMRVGLEAAVSNNDINTFSSLNADDNTGFALKVFTEYQKPLQTTPRPWTLNTKVDFEWVNQHFTPVERFRSVEFTRNWNLNSSFAGKPQYISAASLGVSKANTGFVRYEFNAFLAGEAYEGWKNNLSAHIHSGGFSGDVKGSYLLTKGSDRSTFLRHRSHLKQNLKFISIGFKDEHEQNLFQSGFADSLTAASYRFYDWEVYLSNPDTTGNRFTVFYRQRLDKTGITGRLSNLSMASGYGVKIDLHKSKMHQFRMHSTYRKLEVSDSTLTTQKPENTLISRFEYTIRAWRSALTASTFYEIGTGLEQRREFIYVEVPAGQGVYTWIDYNNNNVKDLDEYEIAAFPDQAIYVRVFTPSNQYIRTFTNQFTQVLRLTPSKIWRNKTGLRKWVARFNTQTTYRADRKSTDENLHKAYNPFLQNMGDATLISLNGSFRNTIWFNRTHPKWGLNYTSLNRNGKTLLSSGFESRNQNTHEGRVRWNLSRKFTLQQEGESGTRSTASDFLNGRNYAIEFLRSRTRLSFQPNPGFRASVIGSYTEKNNSTEGGGEQAFLRDLGTELRYNVVKKGSFLIHAHFISIAYNGLTNTALAFEMLDALQPGINYTWNANWQRNISKHLILHFNYTGRKSENNPTIHTGGMSVRALF